MTSEAEFIERIRRALPSRGPGLRVGIGDDAAVLRVARQADSVITCDMFLEGVHFLSDVYPPDAVGYKALARATSDLAAMGARPRFFLLSLALPRKRTGRWLDGLLRGMSRAARRFGLVLAGGDTAKSSSVAINITVLGEAARGHVVIRSGARPGDLIYISGRLGAAQLGLELILRGLHRNRRWQPLLRPHFYPPLRLKLGQWLVRPRRGAPRGLASSMIDTSDGLSTDLGHICDASGVGATIWVERLPSVGIPSRLAKLRVNVIELALHGGEDYELLFTVPRHLARLVPQILGGVPLRQIGEINRSPEVELGMPGNRVKPLAPKGWDHFLRRRQQTGYSF